MITIRKSPKWPLSQKIPFSQLPKIGSVQHGLGRQNLKEWVTWPNQKLRYFAPSPFLALPIRDTERKKGLSIEVVAKRT
jgi:hypothetical protein